MFRYSSKIVFEITRKEEAIDLAMKERIKTYQFPEYVEQTAILNSSNSVGAGVGLGVGGLGPPIAPDMPGLALAP